MGSNQAPNPVNVSDFRDRSGQLLARALLELEHCQNQGKLDKDQVKSLQNEVTVLNAALETDKQQLDQLKASVAARTNADALAREEVQLYEKRITLYQQSIADYEKEVTRLRAERDRARGLLKWVGAGALLLGIGIGYAFSGK